MEHLEALVLSWVVINAFGFVLPSMHVAMGGRQGDRPRNSGRLASITDCQSNTREAHKKRGRQSSDRRPTPPVSG